MQKYNKSNIITKFRPSTTSDMAIEIERKFLVKGDYKPEASGSHRIIQGYISSSPGRNVRVRILDDKGFITIKGKTNKSGMSRYEWEKEIPLQEAVELIKMCEPGVIEKTRYIVKVGPNRYEVDEFQGENSGLTIAEIELSSEDEVFQKPHWLGKEVTGEPRYHNSRLVKNPYAKWAETDKQ